MTGGVGPFLQEEKSKRCNTECTEGGAQRSRRRKARGLKVTDNAELNVRFQDEKRIRTDGAGDTQRLAALVEEEFSDGGVFGEADGALVGVGRFLGLP